MEIKLSICIPTYNYGAYIGETLDSILSQLTNHVEVIVLDGGSTDETSSVIADYQRNNPQLIYYKENTRGGIDRDIEKLVSLAKGNYCWLFSADDIMTPNAIKLILNEIRSNYDIYICEHTLCNIDMKPISDYPPFNGLNNPTVFDLSKLNQKNDYFKSARTSEAFFSFLAGPIFKKSLWDKAKSDIPESFYGSCWIVAGHLLNAFRFGISVKYLNQKLIFKREGNDSFSNGSRVNRCKIGIENFQHIANTIFGHNSLEAFEIRRVLHRDVPLRSLLSAKMKATSNPKLEDINKLKYLVQIHYSDPSIKNWLCHIIFVITPSFLIGILYFLYIKYKENVN
jgi:abequosyltransferase